LLEDIVTKANAIMPTPVERTDLDSEQAIPANGTPVQIGDGPVHVVSSKADQMFIDILHSGKPVGCCISRATLNSPIIPPVL